MNFRVGHDRVIQESDNYCVFAVQIGITRIGSGGRCMPRTKRGGMTTCAGLVASLVEPQELVHGMARKAAVVARHARAVASLAIWVVAQRVQVAATGIALRILRSDRFQLALLTVGFIGFLAIRPEVQAVLKALMR